MPLFSVPFSFFSFFFHLSNVISPQKMFLNHKISLSLSLYYLALQFNLQKSLSGTRCIVVVGGLGGWRNTVSHSLAVTTLWNIVHLSTQKISCQSRKRHLSKDQIYVRVGSAFNFTWAQHLSPSHSTSGNSWYFFHWIANCSRTQQPSTLFVPLLMDQVRGSCIFHIDQWRCMLIADDYEYLMLRRCLVWSA